MFAGWGMFSFLLIIWVIIWKGIALWLAARNNHKIWFIIILLINTISILEIIYIFAVAMKNQMLKNFIRRNKIW